MIDKIKEALDCKTNRELAKKLNVDESLISRWDHKGWRKSTERLLKLLLDRIDRTESMG